MNKSSLNLPILLLVILFIASLFYAGLRLTKLNTDIVSFLPVDTPVLSDASSILQDRLSQDRIVIDIASEKENPDILVQCSRDLQKALKKSELFTSVGFQSFEQVIPSLIPHILDNLPFLFSKSELEEKVAPLIDQASVRARLKEQLQKMHTLNGLGHGQYLAQDPLGLKDIVLSRLKHLAPVEQTRFYKGEMLSPDGKHLLVVAQLKKSGTSTAYAKKLENLLQDVSGSVTAKYAGKGHELSITPMGSYRAALDNERIIRDDVTLAILLASFGIALLLFFVFPRPLIGLLAFLPALGGTAAAFFTLSLLHQSISLLVLGFGGAIISITVDHGIAYLLFMDRSQESYGREASREIWALGLITALTTMGAFAALCLTNFPLFVQLGEFSALGIAFSFLFVHCVFPHIFPVLPAGPSRNLPFRRIVERLFSTGKTGLFIALGFALLMLFFASPSFNVDMGSMNTVSKDTRTAEKKIEKVWGKQYQSTVYLMTTGDSIHELRSVWDKLQPKIRQDLDSNVLSSGFTPAMIFPGQTLRKEHYADWQKFWNKSRVSRVQKNLKHAAQNLGYKKKAFAPFLQSLDQASYTKGKSIPDKYFSLLGIDHSKDRPPWSFCASLKPGKNYDASSFYQKYKTKDTKIFDPTYFSTKLGDYLRSNFLYLLSFISISVFLLVLIFLFDLRFTLLAFLPVLFALICTLGSLTLLGHPIGIPGLMLSIVVFGMGIDYSLLLVRSFQRYGSILAPNFRLIRLAVFMAALSSLIGFGVLLFAEHSVLKSAGLTSFLGIGYSVVGAFVILPFILERLYWKEQKGPKAKSWKKRVLQRYKNMEAYPRLFARFKVLFDSMFSELPQFLHTSHPIEHVLDIGCGYAVPSCAILEWIPQSQIYAIEPNRDRVRVASRVLGSRGAVEWNYAPHLPQVPEPADAALMLDITHYINDDTLLELFRSTFRQLRNNGLLVLRAVIPPSEKASWAFQLASWKRKLTKEPVYYRSQETIRNMLLLSGFELHYMAPSEGCNSESIWFVAQAPSDGR